MAVLFDLLHGAVVAVLATISSVAWHITAAVVTACVGTVLLVLLCAAVLSLAASAPDPSDERKAIDAGSTSSWRLMLAPAARALLSFAAGEEVLSRALTRMRGRDGAQDATGPWGSHTASDDDAPERHIDARVASALSTASRTERVPPYTRLRRVWGVPGEVARPLVSLLEAIIRDFVMNWYSGTDVSRGLSPDTDFLEAVQVTLTDVLGALAFRAAHTHPAALMMEDLAQVIYVHLAVYAEMQARAAQRYPALFDADARGAEDAARAVLAEGDGLVTSVPFAQLEAAGERGRSVSGQTWQRLREEAQQRAVLHEYETVGHGVLHPAVEGSSLGILCGTDCETAWPHVQAASGPVLPSSVLREQRYLRGVCEQVVSRLVPKKETESKLLSVLLREILTCSVLQPALSAAEPDIINHYLAYYINYFANPAAAAAPSTSSDGSTAASGMTEPATAAASAVAAADVPTETHPDVIAALAALSSTDTLLRVSVPENEFDDALAHSRRRRKEAADGVTPADAESSVDEDASPRVADRAWRYFCGPITRAAAESMLWRCPIGSFLLRSKEGGTLVLSYVRAKAKVVTTEPVPPSATPSAAHVVHCVATWEVAHTRVTFSPNDGGYTILQRGPFATLSEAVRCCRDFVWIGVLADTGHSLASPADTALELLYRIRKRLAAIFASTDDDIQQVLRQPEKLATLTSQPHFASGRVTESAFGPGSAAALQQELQAAHKWTHPQRGAPAPAHDMTDSGFLPPGSVSASAVSAARAPSDAASVRVAADAIGARARRDGGSSTHVSPAAGAADSGNIFSVLGPLFNKAVAMQTSRHADDVSVEATPALVPEHPSDEPDWLSIDAPAASDLAADEEARVEEDWVRAGSFTDGNEASVAGQGDDASIDSDAGSAAGGDDVPVDDEDRLSGPLSAAMTEAAPSTSSSEARFSSSVSLGSILPLDAPLFGSSNDTVTAPAAHAAVPSGSFSELFPSSARADPHHAASLPTRVGRNDQDQSDASAHKPAPQSILAQTMTFSRHSRRWRRNQPTRLGAEASLAVAASTAADVKPARSDARRKDIPDKGKAWLLESDSSGEEPPSRASQGSSPVLQAKAAGWEAELERMRRDAAGDATISEPAAPLPSRATAPPVVVANSVARSQPAEAAASDDAVAAPASCSRTASASEFTQMDFFEDVRRLLDAEHAESILGGGSETAGAVSRDATDAAVSQTTLGRRSGRFDILGNGSRALAALSGRGKASLSGADPSPALPQRIAPLTGLVAKVVRASLRDEHHETADGDAPAGAQAPTSVVRYVVALRVPTADGTGVYAWTVRHRYSEFLALFSLLRRAHGDEAAHATLFPPKRVFATLAISTTSEEFVLARQQALDAWLQAILQRPQFRDSCEVRRFLSPQSRASVTCTGELARAAIAADKAARRKARPVPRRVTFATTVSNGAQRASGDEVPAAPSVEAPAPGGVAAPAPDAARGPAPSAEMRFLTLEEFERAENLLFRIVYTMFGLQSGGWVKRQLVGVVRSMFGLLFRGSTAKRVAAAYFQAFSAESNGGYLRMFYDSMWPKGKLRPPGVTRSWEQQTAAREEALRTMLDNSPAALVSLLGKDTVDRGFTFFHSFCQYPVLVRSLVYCAVDAALARMFPGISVHGVAQLRMPHRRASSKQTVTGVLKAVTAAGHKSAVAIAQAPKLAASAVASTLRAAAAVPRVLRRDPSASHNDSHGDPYTAMSGFAAPASPPIAPESLFAPPAPVTSPASAAVPAAPPMPSTTLPPPASTSRSSIRSGLAASGRLFSQLLKRTSSSTS